MRELCAKCNICTFMPEQDGDRILFQDYVPVTASVVDDIPRVLVIDDVHCVPDMAEGMVNMESLMAGNMQPYTYTTTTRCDYVPTVLTSEQKEEAVSRCAVWTNFLLEGRALVITTVNGLRQMQIGQDKKEGDIFRNTKVGIVVVVPPLTTLTGEAFREYRPKVQRGLKEAGLK